MIDIETSPITGYTWKTWQDNVLKILEPSKILSLSWKYLHDSEVFCKALPDYKGYKKGMIDDEKLVKEAWKLLDEADILIGHHAAKFDIPKLNARFIYHGLPAPSKYQIIDTKRVASRYFKFDSNSLKNLGQYLNCGTKIETGGFDLWVRCIAGDPEAWEDMKAYNTQDVVLLEQVYLKLRPYIENHPNVSLITGNMSTGCPTCQSSNVQKRGFAYTRTSKKQRYQCLDCKSWSSGTLERIKNNNILFSEGK